MPIPMTHLTITEKRCTDCGETKPLEDFHRNPQARDGRNVQCAPCRNAAKKGHYQRWTPEQREKHRLRVARCRYGVEASLIDDLYEQQEGCCAICASPGGHPILGERTRRDGTLCIDHDHEDGAVRGLLCRNCNSAIGKLGDSVERLVKAAAYLIDRGGQ